MQGGGGVYSRTRRTRNPGQITSEVRQEPWVPRVGGLQAAHTDGVHHKCASHQHCDRGQAVHLLPRTRTKGVVLTSNCYYCFWRNKLASAFHTWFLIDKLLSVQWNLRTFKSWNQKPWTLSGGSRQQKLLYSLGSNPLTFHRPRCSPACHTSVDPRLFCMLCDVLHISLCRLEGMWVKEDSSKEKQNQEV